MDSLLSKCSSGMTPDVAPEPPATMEHYNTIDGLLAPVRSGSLAPLSGRFLLELAEGGGHLQRRQDLPADAFFSEEDLAGVRDELRRFVFIALSYRWLTKGHPDPEGFHLGIVTAVVKKWLSMMRDAGIENIGVFWDFGSLYQDPRLGNQEDLFKEGLRASNRWYGSVHSTVWLQRHLPPGFEGPPYDRSGWCFVEASISSAIKPWNGRFDVGLLEIGDLSKGVFDLLSTRKGRMPPLSPDRVEQKLTDEMKFTNRSDVKKVVRLYTSFFVTVSGSTEELTFRMCGWTADHFGGFAEALPFFKSLKTLDLSQNNLCDECAKTLAAFLKANKTITVMKLDGNKIGDGGAIALGESLKVNKTVTEINLYSNNIGDAGAIALAESFKENTALKKIVLWNNEFGEEGKEALRNAKKVRGDMKIWF